MSRTQRPGAAHVRLVGSKCKFVLWAVLCPAALVSLATPGAAAHSPAEKRAAARKQFERGEAQRTALQGKPEKSRTVEEYQRLVNAYRRVYLITPHAAEVPAALVAVAELYRDMGRQFDPRYFQSAIDSYQFLLHEYPTSRYREDALLTIAQIEKDDQDQSDLAEKSFQEFIKLHPRSPRVQEARDALAEIAKERQEAARSARAGKPSAEDTQGSKLPQVTRVRSWNAEDYTRVVIDLEGDVDYQGVRISGPDRIYFDLHRAKLSPTLARKTLDVEPGGFLKGVRVAQNQTGVVRVVLDVEKVKDYSAFLLPNPYRLVVDVYGEKVVATKASAKMPGKAGKGAPAHKEPGAEVAGVTKASAGSESVKPAAGPTRKEAASLETPLPTKPARLKAARPGKEEAAAAIPPPVPQPTRDGQHSLTRALGLKIGRIVIDAGHGGHDTGTIGPTGLMEKDLCLDIALRLGKLIQQRLSGAEVVYTREDDSFIPLETRTAVANQAGADLFISIHANSSRDRKARGIETYYLNFASSEEALEVASRENALSQSSIHELQDLIKKIARNEKAEESRELAGDIQDALSKRLARGRVPIRDRGVRRAPFVVLIGANMPSVLSEVSFISNPTDERLLKRPENRQRVAEGIYHGVESYLASLNSLSYNRTKSSLDAR